MSAQDALAKVLSGNKAFAKKTTESSPEFFKKLAGGQSPEVLWLGCSDSRVPETTVCHCQPGDIFVHRNIANIVQPGDVSAASVVDYAVANLKVKRIIVCGHTKCGGATAALGDADLGANLNAWLGPLRELRRKHHSELEKLTTEDEKAIKLAEINVRFGLDTLRHNPTVAEAMESRGLSLDGLIYDMGAGTLRTLDHK